MSLAWPAIGIETSGSIPRWRRALAIWIDAVEDGMVTEGGSSSAFILTQDDVLVTRQNSSAILPGCTRKAVVALAEERQLRVEERPFTVEEALAAKEAFITSASLFVQAVVTIDGKTVANGKPGPMTDRLREIYIDFARATAQ